VLLPNITKYEY